jgi:hypothetical protein
MPFLVGLYLVSCHFLGDNPPQHGILQAQEEDSHIRIPMTDREMEREAEKVTKRRTVEMTLNLESLKGPNYMMEMAAVNVLFGYT